MLRNILRLRSGGQIIIFYFYICLSERSRRPLRCKMSFDFAHKDKAIHLYGKPLSLCLSKPKRCTAVRLYGFETADGTLALCPIKTSVIKTFSAFSFDNAFFADLISILLKDIPLIFLSGNP